MRLSLTIAGIVLGRAALAGTADVPALVTLRTPEPAFEAFRVPDGGGLCRAGAPLEIELARPAAVTLALASHPASAAVDGVAARPIDRLPLAPGRHRLFVLPSEAQPALAQAVPFAVEADDGSGPQRVRGEIHDDLVNRPVLPVGRTFVEGVDLLDGHLVLQSTDIKLEGRHLALELSRTYSSAGPFARSPLGAGWSHSYDMQLAAVPACGLWVVRTADGGSQAFRSEDDGRTFSPQRGYHTRLLRAEGGAFEFVDKAGNRHRFRETAWPGAPLLRLEWIEEPHGDRIVPDYDAAGRVARVHEWHPGVGPVRTLLLDWTEAAGWPRIRSARAWGLGLKVDYRYDRHGNLALVTRSDAEDEGATQSDRYEYSTDHASLRHRLTARLEAGAARVDYAWEPARPGPAPASGPPRLLPAEAVVRAVDPAPAGSGLDEFIYDRSHAAEGVYLVEVRYKKTSVTRYRLNGDGNPLEIDQPEGTGRKVSRMRWDHRHITKIAEESTSGYRAEWAYDGRGNVTSEIAREKAGAPAKTTLYEYDPLYNKLVRKVAPGGDVTRYEIRPANGDLTQTVEPGGKVTTYAYDPHGCLTLKVQTGQRTVYSGQDSYCQATLIRRPDGTVLRRRFDARGRLREPAAGGASAKE
jgi:YD repeat-containing protein